MRLPWSLFCCLRKFVDLKKVTVSFQTEPHLNGTINNVPYNFKSRDHRFSFRSEVHGRHRPPIYRTLCTILTRHSSQQSSEDSGIVSFRDDDQTTENLTIQTNLDTTEEVPETGQDEEERPEVQDNPVDNPSPRYWT